LYEVKELKQMDVLPITIAFCAFVVCSNLSLQHNSVGFYQLMKVLTTPVVGVLQKVFYDIDVHPQLQMCLAVICCGVAIATVSDFSLNLVGTIWALCGLLATAFYQLQVKNRQTSLKCNALQVRCLFVCAMLANSIPIIYSSAFLTQSNPISLLFHFLLFDFRASLFSFIQLLHYQAPQAAAVVLCLVPVLESVPGILSFEYSSGLMMSLILACALAFFVNLSIFLVIGHTDPVT
jgi:solute carrier family 35 protein E3